MKYKIASIFFKINVNPYLVLTVQIKVLEFYSGRKGIGHFGAKREASLWS